MIDYILLLSLFLVIMNGFFVAAEFGMVKVRPSFVEELYQKGNHRAKIIKYFINRLDAYLSATQIGITLASLAFGWLAEPYFASLFLSILHDIIDVQNPEYKSIIETMSFGFAFFLISAAHMTLGEIAPKNLSIQKAEKVAFFVAYPMIIFYYIFYPLVKTFNALANFLLKLIGVNRNFEFEASYSDKELNIILSSMVNKGSYSIDKKDLIENAFKFHKKRVEQIMVPRNEIYYFSIEQSLEKTLSLAKESNYTRFPLCSNNNLDEIIGIINIKDIFWRTDDEIEEFDLKTFVRETIYVPEKQSLHALLQEFQKNKIHIAIVVDEYGATSGLVTIEDIMEEIVGEIQDEHDDEAEKFIFYTPNEIEVDGLVLIDEVKEVLKISYIKPIANTIGGYVLNVLGRIPKVGDKVIIGDFQVIIKRVEHFRVSRILFRRFPKGS